MSNALEIREIVIKKIQFYVPNEKDFKASVSFYSNYEI